MPLRLKTTNRKLHYWGSVAIALPLAVVLVSGILLLLKKDLAWIQPPTISGEQRGMALGFDEILSIARTVAEAGIETWDDVDRIDVRPGKGMIKVQAKSRWEIQLDANSGAILQVAYRRSDVIESIHDGSFFGDAVKLWLFPAFCALAFRALDYWDGALLSAPHRQSAQTPISRITPATGKREHLSTLISPTSDCGR